MITRFALRRLTYCLPSQASTSLQPTYASLPHPAVDRAQVTVRSNEPTKVERLPSTAARSMARGLVLNEINEESMMMPELEDVEEVKTLNEFVQVMKMEIDNNLDIDEMHKHRRRPALIMDKLAELGVNSIRIPHKYGGLGLQRQHWMRVCEELGSHDLSLFVNVSQNNDFAVWALEQHGSEEQKMQYLPRLARGEINAAVCLQEPKTGFDLSAFRTHIEQTGEGLAYLSGTKSYVVNAHNADVFIVWAHLEQSGVDGQDENKVHSMYIVEKNAVNAPHIRILPKLDTAGLPGVEMSTVQFDRVQLDKRTDLLGLSPMAGFECAMQMIEQCGLALGAAVVGISKKVIDEYCQYANRTARFESRLSELPSVRQRIASLAQRTFALETLVYYTSGHMDVSGDRIMDSEACIVQREALRLLREVTLTASEVFGADALLANSRYNRLLMDCTTLASSAVYVNEDFLTNGLAMSALTAWADKWSGKLEKLRMTPDNFFFSMYHQMKAVMQMDKPKLTHDLFKHVHPSLEKSARMLEESMVRVETAISLMLSEHGRDIERRPEMLTRLADVTHHLAIMVAVISRSSRAYSVGLKGADMEMIIAHKICLSHQIAVNELLIAFMNPESRVDVAETLADKVASSCLEKNGYPFESPLERNW